MMTTMDERLDKLSGTGNDAPAMSVAISPTAMALLAASMAKGPSRIINAAFDPAIPTLIDGLRQLGAAILADEAAGRIEITGHGGHWVHGDLELNCGCQSPTAHLLLAACVLDRSRCRLTNLPAMTASFASLIDALSDLGAQIHPDHDASGSGIQIGPALFRGGRTTIQNSDAAGAVACLLLVAPCAAGDVFLEVPPWPVRPAEVIVALRTLEDCEIAVIDDQATHMIVPAPQCYAACQHDISIRGNIG
ncbi:MAG: hypothetical protein ACUVXJ_00555 [Phycisphaerae bacterium]